MSTAIITCTTEKEFNEYYEDIKKYAKKYLPFTPPEPKKYDDGYTACAGYIGKSKLITVRIKTRRLK